VAAAALVVALVAVIGMSRARSDVAGLRAEVEQLRGGVALFTSQATDLQGRLAELAPAVEEGLAQAVAGLEAFAGSTIAFDVPIDESVPIETEIVLDRILQVPIEASLPIDQTIDTTITVQGPFGIDIPLDITVPIVLDLPIDLDVAIPVNESIPIAADVPVRLTLPVSVDVSATELGGLADSLRAGLEAFMTAISALG
jgi:hypothetical protein